MAERPHGSAAMQHARPLHMQAVHHITLARSCGTDASQRHTQDENRHGDFFAAVMKARCEYLQDWQAKLWSRFFCHSVFITMYLNDHQRTSFYEALGLNTKQFNRHVIVETNNSTARLFPAVRHSLLAHMYPLAQLHCLLISQANLTAHVFEIFVLRTWANVRWQPGYRSADDVPVVQVPDTSAPEYWDKMERLVDLNNKLLAINKSDAPAILKKLQQAPIIERMVANVWQLFISKPMEIGSVDVNEPALSY
jgi:hypothetical protein